LNLNQFKMVEEMRLKIAALRSPWMISPTYQTSWKFTNRFKSISEGQTDRQNGDLISLLSFFESKLKSTG
jgi:hypothetical protein